jgi:hypothetical protein
MIRLPANFRLPQRPPRRRPAEEPARVELTDLVREIRAASAYIRKLGRKQMAVAPLMKLRFSARACARMRASNVAQATEKLRCYVHALEAAQRAARKKEVPGLREILERAGRFLQ